MPRKTQPPRLVLRKDRRDADGKITHQAQWRIHDRGKKIDTGCGESDFEGAKKALTEYIIAQHNEKPTPTGGTPETVLIGDLISYYLKRKTKHIETLDKDAHRDYVARFERLIDFWGGKYVIEIDEDTCGDYQEHGTKPLADSTHRKHLEYLRAVIRLGSEKRKVLLAGLVIDYDMPPKSKARLTWYTRDMIARLIHAAYRRQYKNGNRPLGHLARFILVAVYTGTRSNRIQRASFVQEEGRPWLDLDNGIFYRKWHGEKGKRKPADPVRIPEGLLSHMRRWHKNGAKYLIEVNGEPTGNCRSSFRRLVIDVLGEEEAVGYNRHTLRHTTATWLMKVGHPKDDIARYLSCTPEVIESVYGHFHPEWMESTTKAFGSHRQGRVFEMKQQKLRYEAEMQKQAQEARQAAAEQDA